MVFRDKKEKMLFDCLWEKIINRQFDEFTIYSFLILIREVCRDSLPSSVKDYGDLIAHRERDRGKALDAISVAKNNGYLILNDGKVSGYDGISEEQWIKEWKEVARIFDCDDKALSDICIHEIIICILSLSQFSQYKKADVDAEMILAIGKNGKLGLCTHEKARDKGYVVFTVLENISFINPERYAKNSYQIDEAVIAIRENGALRLKAESGYII